MSNFPSGITLRTVTYTGVGLPGVGDEQIIEIDVLPLTPLIWKANRWQMPAHGWSVRGLDTASLAIPATDQIGYQLPSGENAGSPSTQYWIRVRVYYGANLVNEVSKIVPLPTGDGSPVDLDTMLPVGTVGTVAGGAVLVPDSLSARLDALEAGGVGSATRGLIVTDTDVPTIPDGDTTDNLAAYYNSAAEPITVAGVELAAGSHAVWAWVAGTWSLLASGVSGGNTTADSWTPAAPTFDDEARAYIIPEDQGATYTVGGVTQTAGVHPAGSNAETVITVVAVVKSGYTFASGATTSWPHTFAAATYASGDVIMSDSFERADGNLIGSTTDSFAGGEPMVWANSAGSDARIASGRAVPSGSMSAFQVTLPVELGSIAVDAGYYSGGGLNVLAAIILSTGDTLLLRQGGELHQTKAGGGTVKLRAALRSPGEVLRFTWNSATQATSLVNVTTGVVAPLINAATAAGNAVTVLSDLRYGEALESIKVHIP